MLTFKLMNSMHSIIFYVSKNKCPTCEFPLLGEGNQLRCKNNHLIEEDYNIHN